MPEQYVCERVVVHRYPIISSYFRYNLLFLEATALKPIQKYSQINARLK